MSGPVGSDIETFSSANSPKNATGIVRFLKTFDILGFLKKNGFLGKNFFFKISKSSDMRSNAYQMILFHKKVVSLSEWRRFLEFKK